MKLSRAFFTRNDDYVRMNNGLSAACYCALLVLEDPTDLAQAASLTACRRARRTLLPGTSTSELGYLSLLMGWV